ncbi:Uncharacterized protein OBRU01_06828 [Operophtera brumata]|uniref:WKF domain-containing protein n=1 Tax=Operophtera brumata TaxID=104452 RepID=A0A0L7LDB6_OPEBR|nr:Uncharacterized protein OBRU01_06828 [Operophtera brumata]
MAGKNKRKRNNKKNALKKANLPDSEQKEDIEDVRGGEIDESVDDEQKPVKRTYTEDDSDAEEKPKRKKKKKQPVPGDTTDNKGKKSIRQMKKDKHAQRQAETEAASKDQLKSQCINYLSQWKHDKQNWKFMKIKQVWLFKNKFSSKLVPDSSWKTLLEYFESAQGNIRNMLLDDANKVIMQMDEWTESQKGNKQEKTDDKNENEETDTQKEKEITKPDDIAYKRARDLIQCLH